MGAIAHCSIAGRKVRPMMTWATLELSARHIPFLAWQVRRGAILCLLRDIKHLLKQGDRA